jgi:hypothetical protein
MFGSGVPSSHNRNPCPMFDLSSMSRRCRGMPAHLTSLLATPSEFPNGPRLEASRRRCQARRQSYGVDRARHRARFISSAGRLDDDREAMLVHWALVLRSGDVVDGTMFLIATHLTDMSRACELFSTSARIAIWNGASLTGAIRPGKSRHGSKRTSTL